MARFAQDVEVFENPCPGLVNLIERVQFDETVPLLQEVVQPMLAADVDTLVLGCTHYPFVIPMLEKVAGTAVSIIDPAPAVARQVKRVLDQSGLLAAHSSVANLDLVTTGMAAVFSQQVQQLLGYEHEVKTAVWQQENDILTLQFSQVLL
ncbi:MAG: hypothetical protein GWP17_04930 [Aquificales bacterium]|nr:hypothetical protein [Aquificales bacterium]